MIVENHVFEVEINQLPDSIDVNNLNYNLKILDQFVLNANHIDKSWEDFQNRTCSKESDTMLNILLKVS
ncbi:MAG: hypothetical protein IPO92_14605 [Saprospiraceae bacterium]|nr:hypothetical protein [Saprospiraceae bacterium]